MQFPHLKRREAIALLGGAVARPGDGRADARPEHPCARRQHQEPDQCGLQETPGATRGCAHRNLRRFSQRTDRANRRSGIGIFDSRHCGAVRVRSLRPSPELRTELLQRRGVRRAFTSVGYSRAKSRATCPYCNRPGSSSSSTSKPPRHSALRCRRRCSPSPTR
jgi:hypothetical protein